MQPGPFLLIITSLSFAYLCYRPKAYKQGIVNLYCL